MRIESRQGIYLATPSHDEFFELLQMREVLEGLAARRAASNNSRQNYVEAMAAYLAAFDDDTVNTQRSRYASADHRFHRHLIRASESDELIKSLGVINLRLHMNRMRSLFSRGHDLVPIHHEHLAIVAVLEAGDAELSERLVRAHIRNVP